jgi:hypothetical protein
MLQKALERHGMATHAAEMEEITVALPLSMIKTNLVVVIVAAKRHAEFFKLKPFRFFGIPLGFLDFSDHPVVHRQSPWKKKGTVA